MAESANDMGIWEKRIIAGLLAGGLVFTAGAEVATSKSGSDSSEILSVKLDGLKEDMTDLKSTMDSYRGDIGLIRQRVESHSAALEQVARRLDDLERQRGQ